MLGLWLALLLNKHLPFKSFFRAIVLLPFIVPTALSAIAFWWIYDAQFSVISWVLTKMGLIDRYIDFLGDPWNARLSTIAANVWRGVPFVAICLLAGLQTISPSFYEAASLDGATPWQQFRYVTLPLLTPIIAVVMTFSVLFTFTDFQLIYVLTRGGPLNATHLMATLSFQRAIPGGALGEGAALAVAMVPFLLAAILFSYFGLQRRRWQQGGGTDVSAIDPAAQALPPTRRVSRKARPRSAARRRHAGHELPRVAAAPRGHALRCRSASFLFVLLFPFYWMVDHVVQAQRGAALARGQPVLGAQSHARALPQAAVRHGLSRVAVEHDARRGRVRRSCRSPQRVRRLRDRAAALPRLALGRHGHLPRLPRAAVDPVHPARARCFKLGLFDTRLALILTYPTFLIPFCTWLLMGYFRSIPFELEECALIDGATRWQILTRIVLPLAVPGLISAGIFAFTLSWNEFIYALTFISSSEVKTVPVGVITELVEGDVYHWGSLMAGALLGSLPVAILYSFFVEYYVPG